MDVYVNAAGRRSSSTRSTSPRVRHMASHCLNQALVSDEALAGQEFRHGRTPSATQFADPAAIQQLGERALVHDIQNAEKVSGLILGHHNRSKHSQEVEAGSSRCTGCLAPHAQGASRCTDMLPPRIQRADIRRRVRREHDGLRDTLRRMRDGGDFRGGLGSACLLLAGHRPRFHKNPFLSVIPELSYLMGSRNRHDSENTTVRCSSVEIPERAR